MHRTLNDYYDSNTGGMLRWMQLSIVGLMLLALMVPFVIFTTADWLLFVIAIIIYFFIFYLVDSFCYYLTSNAPAKTLEQRGRSRLLRFQQPRILSPHLQGTAGHDARAVSGAAGRRG